MKKKIMKGNCLDIGKIQQFLDGELDSSELMSVSGHFAECTVCSMHLSAAEEEYAFVNVALERELDTLIPTQRLWTRINETLAEEKKVVPIWRRYTLSLFSQLFTSPMPAAAMGVAVIGIVAFSVVIFNSVLEQPLTDNIVAVDRPSRTNGQNAPVIDSDVQQNVMNTAVSNEAKTLTSEPVADRTAAVHASHLTTAIQDNRQRARATQAVYRYVPGEESYIAVISDMTNRYKRERDAAFTPSGRVAFERDLAVVDHAIKRVRDAVKKNPNDAAARQMLYSAYQDKIDLLNSAGQKAEMMAAVY